MLPHQPEAVIRNMIAAHNNDVDAALEMILEMEENKEAVGAARAADLGLLYDDPDSCLRPSAPMREDIHMLFVKFFLRHLDRTFEFRVQFFLRLRSDELQTR